MIVSIDNGYTKYEYGKNCIVKIYKRCKDNEENLLFVYGFKNSIMPRFSVWSLSLPSYYTMLINLAFTYVGFDRNFEEKDIRSLVMSLQRYIKRNKNINNSNNVNENNIK